MLLGSPARPREARRSGSEPQTWRQRAPKPHMLLLHVVFPPNLEVYTVSIRSDRCIGPRAAAHSAVVWHVCAPQNGSTSDSVRSFWCQDEGFWRQTPKNHRNHRNSARARGLGCKLQEIAAIRPRAVLCGWFRFAMLIVTLFRRNRVLTLNSAHFEAHLRRIRGASEAHLRRNNAPQMRLRCALDAPRMRLACASDAPQMRLKMARNAPQDGSDAPQNGSDAPRMRLKMRLRTASDAPDAHSSCAHRVSPRPRRAGRPCVVPVRVKAPGATPHHRMCKIPKNSKTSNQSWVAGG